MLDQFFAASRLRDSTALSPVSSTLFDPSQHGTVLSFDVLSVHVIRPDLKEVHLRALVRPPRGEAAPKALSILLQKVEGRWSVSGFSDVTDTPVSPAGPPN